MKPYNIKKIKLWYAVSLVIGERRHFDRKKEKK